MTENITNSSWPKRILYSKGFRWGGIIIIAIGVILFIISFLLDEPLRSRMENKLNQDLKGYSVKLAGLHFNPISLSLTMKGLSILQDAHSVPPVAYFPVIKASINWTSILAGKLVAEFRLDQPKLSINLQQLRNEAANKTSIKERGWQQAVEDIYPLKINNLKVHNASITYIDEDPKRPLILSNLNLLASNIRNIKLPDQVYPSSFHLDTAIFDTGHGSIDGNANLLSEPFPGIKGRIKLEKVAIDNFRSVFARSNLAVEGGLLRASGDAEYAPKVKIAHLETMEIQGMKMDYIHSKQTAIAEKKRAAKVRKAARKLSNKQDLLIIADKLVLKGCILGFVNKAANKPYRLYIADTDLQMSNFSNQFSRGNAEAQLKGKFMGSGLATASAKFRPEKSGPDMDLYLKIDETQLTSMNNLLRSYGDFDVSAGVFALVTELHIKNNNITGYIKPFFKDMKVYDKRKDKKRGIAHQMYEILVGGVASLLENRSQQEVATKANIKGKVENPETSSFQIIGQLIKNAFFKAILPSFEKEAAGTRKN